MASEIFSVVLRSCNLKLINKDTNEKGWRRRTVACPPLDVSIATAWSRKSPLSAIGAVALDDMAEDREGGSDELHSQGTLSRRVL